MKEKEQTDNDLSKALNVIWEKNREVSMIYATGSFMHQYFDQARVKKENPDAFMDLLYPPRGCPHNTEILASKLYDQPLTVLPDSCEETPRFWIASKRKELEEVSCEGKRLNELTEEELKKYILYNSKMDKWRGHPNENEIIGQLYGKPVLLPKKKPVDRSKVAPNAGITCACEEKPNWPTGLDESLEGEHLDTLCRIKKDLENILDTTGHKRNRDWGAISEVRKEVARIISWSEARVVKK